MGIQMLPFILAMFVAMDNGVEVEIGYQFSAWLAFVGGIAIDMLKTFKRN